ncbi:MAG: choice-of-anchor Q domain-containing protein, partial [Nannocystaceae bacterium]
DPVGADSAGAVIRDDVVIVGDAGGDTVLEADGIERAIDVVADANVIVSDLTIRRSDQAVRCEGDNDGALALANVKLIQNRQAVEALGCSLWVSNSRFENNGDPDLVDLARPGVWENPLGNSPAGAGIYIVDSGLLLINDSTFLGNFAAEGGALFSDNTPVEISGSSFTTNFAYAGGAVGVAGLAITVGNSQPLEVSIQDTEFLHNQAAYRGGAIHSLVRTDIDEVTFSDNRVFANPAPLGGNIIGGGALFSFTANIHDSIFHANYVQGQPRNDLAQAMNLEPDEVNNQEITWAYLGGAVGFETIDTILEPGHEDERDSQIEETIFLGNYIELGGNEPLGNELFAGGGAIAGNINSLVLGNETGAHLQVKDSILAQNHVTAYETDSSSFGGAIALSHGEVTDSWLTHNQSIAGGGVACWNCEEVHVDSSTFNTNTADRAAAIFVHWEDRWEDQPAISAPVPLRVENATFTANQAARNVIAQRSLPVRANLKIEPEVRFSTFVDNQTPNASLFGLTPAKLRANIFQNNKVGVCDLQAISEGFNVFEKLDPCTLLVPSDLPNTFADVGPLSTFNGGLTPTHAIAEASPAAVFVPSKLCPQFDQRDVERPVLEPCDAGSFEHWEL